MAETDQRELIDLTNDSDDSCIHKGSPLVIRRPPKSTPVPLPRSLQRTPIPLPASLQRTPVPLPASLQHPPRPASLRPKQTPVPVPISALRKPSNVGYLQRSAPVSSATGPPSDSPYIRTSAAQKTTEVQASTHIPTSGWKTNVSAPYAPVYTNTYEVDATDLGIKVQADKRRKLSLLTKNTTSTSQRLSLDSSGVENGTSSTKNEDDLAIRSSRGLLPRVFRERQHRDRAWSPTTGRLPSVQALNSALNGSGSGTSSAPNISSAPRVLHIARISETSNSHLESSQISTGTPDVNLHNGVNTVLNSFQPQTTASTKSSEMTRLATTDRPSLHVLHATTSTLASSPTHNMQVPLATANGMMEDTPKLHTKFTNRFTEGEDHLLIFLKEVKGFSWKEISKRMPSREQYSLQSRYSSYLNRRDRSQDPSRLSLPEEYAADAGLHRQQQDSLAPPKKRRGRPPRSSLPVDGYQMSHARASIPSRVQYGSLREDLSSASDSGQGQVRARSRRSVQQINYAWPAQDHSFVDEEGIMESYITPSEMHRQNRSALHSEEPSIEIKHALIVDKPLEVNLDNEDAQLALHVATPGHRLPYLSSLERSIVLKGAAKGEWDQVYGRTWQGVVLHVDLTHDEMSIVGATIAKTLALKSEVQSSRQAIHKILKNLPEQKLMHLAYGLRRRLHSRDKESIAAFLEDARTGKTRTVPRIERLGAVRPNTKHNSNTKESILSHIVQRELGMQSRRGWKSASRALSYQTKNSVFDSLGPAYSYRGASSDVHTVAWSPNGQFFAAGAICVTDQDSMQYNKPNNLLYGDLNKRIIHEVAEHRVPRPKSASGPNSTNAMYVTQDPNLYTTVSMVAFSPMGDYMFSAGYDRFACVWSINSDDGKPQLLQRLKHKAEIDLLTVSCDGKLATAAKRHGAKSIKVISINGAIDIQKQSYTSRKASERVDQNILPTALQFDPSDGRKLLAGFGANVRRDGLDVNGDICLWDVETQYELTVHGSTRNVFDVAFMPRQPWQPVFAVGCVAGANVNRGTRSVVRLYDYRGLEKFGNRMELECPALDMNEVVFCPHDENILVASCTSGSVYLWDIRNPDNVLYQLSHGKSLMPLQEDLDPEFTDTGVRFMSWGDNATRLYTGSSDGVVKVWDVIRSPKDVFIKDLITTDSGIMSGAFSNDKSRLILGEVNGSVNVLETGHDDWSVKDAEQLKYLPYASSEDDCNAEEDSSMKIDKYWQLGREIGNQKIASGEMQYTSFSGLPIRQAVQGPQYAGPFDASLEAPTLRERAHHFQRSLAEEPVHRCTILCCADNIPKMTVEDIGDSGESTDRIPDELRKHWTRLGTDLTVVSGKTMCKQCGRPARPSPSTSSQDIAAFCELCSFACFRCGASNIVRPEMETIWCQNCNRVWEMGALGYECLKDSDKRVLLPEVPRLKRYEEELLVAADNEDDFTFGDEMNALTDYYFSLTIERPPSPPF